MAACLCGLTGNTFLRSSPDPTCRRSSTIRIDRPRYVPTISSSVAPLSLAASQSFQPARREQLRHEYDTDPLVRHGHRLSSTVWGVVLLVEALVRVPLVYTLPVSVMVGVGEAMSIAAFAGLISWNLWYVRRAGAREAAARDARSPEAE